MEQTPKQQAVERIKDANNILVTVSKNPTVDQLAACIGFTLLLNKLGKHATAVFSGAVPSTLEFLQPEKTIEQNTDSLRDFIIALDKSKADKLRYKVEDEVVRIFITPYRTSISEKDLEFSQGDFNVDVVVALGVTNKEDIDQAIVAHGRILHDATVISVTDGQNMSDVGAINWHDDTASSLSEMLVSITESFQSGLLDGQMATAFLTGIVAETERFSNDKTSPKVMTMSAQLMAAGANQQLIATKLAPPPPEPEPEPAENLVPEQAVEPYQPPTEKGGKPAEESEKPKNDGEIEISHEEDKDEIHIDDQGNLKKQEELRAAEEAERKRREEADRLASNPDEDAQTPTPDSYLAGSSHKIVQPINNDLDDPFAAFAPVAAPQDAEVSASEPALQLPPVTPIESAVPPLAAEALAAAEPIAPVLQEQLPSAPPAEVPQVNAPITQPEPAWSLPAQDSQATAAPDTLASLEQAVNSPHAEQVEPQPQDLSAARAVVETAALDSIPRPVASQSVGAQTVELGAPAITQAPSMPGVGDVLQQTSAVVPDSQVIAPTDPMAPPPVPPPMMPQYFSPNSGHAYLNPSDSDQATEQEDAPTAQL